MNVFSVAVALSFVAAAVSGKAQDAPGSGPSNVHLSEEGKQVYEQICQACHMADAKGGGGAGASIPALANNPNLAKPEFMIDILHTGRGGMPWFTDMLTPAQMAAVITYVRSHFNNYPDPVTEADVRRFEAGPAKKSDCNCVQ